MKVATSHDRFDPVDRVLRLLLTIHDLNRTIIMQEFDDTKAGLQAIIDAAKESATDATRQRGFVDQALALMQAQNARIAELAAQAGGATPAQMAELVAMSQAALVDMAAANVTRDAADADLAAGTAASTPAP